MDNVKLQVESWDIEKLVPYIRNPRKNDEQVDRMCSAIREFGFRIPIVAKSDGTVVDGHLRLKAAKKLGLKEVPVALADELTDTQVKAFRLLANQSANWAEWDTDLLKLELDDLKLDDFDIDMLGFEDDFLDGLKDPTEVVEDVPPEPQEVPISREGDIWLCGQHRVMCGDCTDAGTVALLMNGEKADLVFTDPPYGMGKQSDGVENDNLYRDDLLDFNKKWIPISFDFAKDNGSWYCWGIDEPLMDIYSEILKPKIRNKEISFRNLIIWNKKSGMGMSDDGLRCYPPVTEKCLFVMIGSESCQGFVVNACDYSDTMDKVRLYLDSEIRKLGLSDDKIGKALGFAAGRAVGHWHNKSQFALPTKENYERLREYGLKVLAEQGKKDYDFLKKDYDELKKDYDELKKDYDELKKDFYEGRSYFDNTHDNMSDVWDFQRTSQKERESTGGHATPKPLALCERAIKSSCPENGLTIDFFGGSGSTLIACEQTKRRCFTIEISPHYVDVIVRRWQQLTGENATLEGDGRDFQTVSEERMREE